MPLLCALYTIPSCTNFPMLASSKGTAGCAHCPESDVDGDEIIIEIIGYLNFDRDISVPISHALDKYYENPHFLLKHLKEFIQVGLNVCSQVVGLKIKRLFTNTRG